MERELDFSQGVLKVKDAAAFIGVSPSGLWNLMDEGVIPYVQDKPGGRRRIPKAELIAYLKGLRREMEAQS